LTDRLTAGALAPAPSVRPRGRRRAVSLVAAAVGAALCVAGTDAKAASESRSGARPAASPLTISVDDRSDALTNERAPASTDIGLTLYSDPASGRRLALGGNATFGDDPAVTLGATGNDYAGWLELSQPFGRFSLFASAGYQLLGPLPGFEQTGGTFGSFGGSYNLTEKLSIGASFDASESVYSLGPQRELSLYFGTSFNEDWQLRGYLLRGLADASDTWGAGLTLSIPLRW
jgi:hypothetical protein